MSLQLKSIIAKHVVSNVDKSLFTQLAAAQRAAPEEAMLRLQHAQISQLYGHVAEHLGDLTHRMSEEPTFESGGYGYVKEKVDKCLHYLQHKYGFWKECAEQIESNVKYNIEKRDSGPKTVDDAWSQLESLARDYADEHSKLPVFNEVQTLARDAAVAFGKFDFASAIRDLNSLKGYLDAGRDVWVAKAHEVPREIKSSHEDKLHKLSEIRSFSGKVAYCNQNFKRLGSGSGRIVYEYDPKHVLKLAKNSKGVAQNEVESDWMIAQHYSIVAKVVSAEEDRVWVIAERAEKINKSTFKRLLGFPMQSFYFYLKLTLEPSSPFRPSIPEEDVKLIEASEWTHEVLELMNNFSLMAGDMGRVSTYGLIDDRVVITDYGLTKDVYEDYYSR